MHKPTESFKSCLWLALALMATLALGEDMNNTFANGLEASGWAATIGDVKVADAVLQMDKDASIEHIAALESGVYELLVSASGSGRLSLAVEVPNRDSQDRHMALTAEFGLYGMLFKVDSEDPVVDVTARIQLVGERLRIQGAAVVAASAEQEARWAAANESYTLLGYYGSDPHRPLPNVGTADPPPKFDPDQMAKWAITEAVIFHDDDYDAHWVTDAAGVAAFFGSRGMPVLTAPKMTAWLEEKVRTQSAIGTAATFVMGVAPTTIVYKPYERCLLANYLRAGGRVVWLSNHPMYMAQAETGSKITYGDEPRNKILGLKTDRSQYYGAKGASVYTSAAEAWGLEPGLSLVRPANNHGLTAKFVLDPSGRYCGTGMVNLCPSAPLSGFIWVGNAAKPDDMALLRNVYRLSHFSGQSVMIPNPKPVVVKKRLPLTLNFGKANRRACYTRDEQVPLYLGVTDQLDAEVAVELTVRDGEDVLYRCAHELQKNHPPGAKLVGAISLAGLRVGKYPVAASIRYQGEVIQLERTLWVSPKPDHEGTHVAVWLSISDKPRRTQDALTWLVEHNIEPLFVDNINDLGRDQALWHGLSFAMREHGEVADGDVPTPAGYDNWRRGGSDRVLRVRAWGDKRESRGYASPFRRQAEADDLGESIVDHAQYPAFRQRVLTGDDYSQWFGLDYNRFNVEGFKAKYGIDAPRPPEAADPYGGIGIKRKPGLIPDDDPWILLSRYWSESVLGDMGTRLSDAVRRATDGRGKIGPIPGGMQLPVMQTWSSQYPPFNFGHRKGFNLSCFYYYNTYWQPPLAHIWWLECARMANRDIEQWIMPDNYAAGESQSYYRHTGWLCFAGGATGLEYFIYGSRAKAGTAAMSMFGRMSQRYGRLLGELKPERKRVGMLVPFAEVAYNADSCYALAYPFIQMLQAHVDVEPVCAEELDDALIREYDAIVVAQIKHMREGTAALLERYVANGGKVLVDTISAKLPIQGATALGIQLAECRIQAYGHAEQIAATRQAINAHVSSPVRCSDPFVLIRRFRADVTPYLWLVHTHTSEEYLAMRKAREANKGPDVEVGLGFGREQVPVELTLKNTTAIPYDVLAGKPLAYKQAGANLTLKITMPKWEGMLVALLPAAPDALHVQSPNRVVPGQELRFALRLLAAGNLVSTTLPVQLTVTDPDGQSNREYRRRLLLRDGVTNHAIRFATNDRQGEWTFLFEEPVTGLAQQVVVTLAAPRIEAALKLAD